MEQASREQPAKKFTKQDICAIGSFVLFIGGLGLMADGGIKSVNIEDEVNQQYPEIVYNDMVQQAREEAVIFEGQVRSFILHDKAKEITSLVENNPRIKQSIKTTQKYQVNQLQRLQLEAKLRDKRHVFQELTIGALTTLFSAFSLITLYLTQYVKMADRKR